MPELKAKPGELLEPFAELMLAEIREAVAAGGSIKNMPDRDVHALSAAISAKRQADSLEKIEQALTRLSRAEYNGAILTQSRNR